ncbi:multiprotein-bridging factor 1c-like [Cynara cardunculus var. scolymus]|uniref:Lambda repressor-like, DNA-binding domain-containing protein n=1 Tax=Cynara cardunculus var. scolymus TaxID=59895 RepID=A0A103XBL7_CYNCS|nr:multiprotein-bridging factor 1c-like [Cynara cardunculus var. scolymus]KVH87736.1 Lambda repressor-like, DNA-binding domain-containing protein [Cynara cardunculus var. scolymus]
MPTRTTRSVSQDWEPIVLHKSRPKSEVLRDPKAVNQALRSRAKLDEVAEPATLGRVSPEVRQLIQKARIDKKISQDDLAKQINERPVVVQESENGKVDQRQANVDSC